MISIGVFVLLFFFIKNSRPEVNQYGPSPGAMQVVDIQYFSSRLSVK
jgi:hypothetical protein